MFEAIDTVSRHEIRQSHVCVPVTRPSCKQESPANAKVSARQQCVYESP